MLKKGMEMIRKELKGKFIKELTPSEKVFFLKKAEEVINQKGYQASEDLFHYCYFLTMKKRLRAISPASSDGYQRILLVETKKEIDEEIRFYEKRLEANKLPKPDKMGHKFIAFLSE